MNKLASGYNDDASTTRKRYSILCIVQSPYITARSTGHVVRETPM